MVNVSQMQRSIRAGRSSQNTPQLLLSSEFFGYVNVDLDAPSDRGGRKQHEQNVLGEAALPDAEAAGACVEKADRFCWTEAGKAELRRAAVEAVGRDAGAGRRVDEAFPEVEVDGRTVEAGAGGAPGAVLVLGGGGPVQEGSGGWVALEVCSRDVSVEELNPEPTRREESAREKGRPPPPNTSRVNGRSAPGASKQKTANFWSSLVAHGTTPVLPLPHLVSAVSRGTTAIPSAVQPNLGGEHV